MQELTCAARRIRKPARQVNSHHANGRPFHKRVLNLVSFEKLMAAVGVKVPQSARTGAAGSFFLLLAV
jgi:hypothetical protein